MKILESWTPDSPASGIQLHSDLVEHKLSPRGKLALRRKSDFPKRTSNNFVWELGLPATKVGFFGFCTKNDFA